MGSHDVMSLLSRDSLHHINNIIVVCVVMLSSREDPNGLSRCNVPTLQRQLTPHKQYYCCLCCYVV